MRRTTFRNRTGGFSLLEVMFSIGIVGIGLLGAAALIPLGGYQARQGIKADTAAATGRRAIRDFDVRGMKVFSQWRRYDRTTNSFLPFVPDHGKCYCLDPLYIGTKVEESDRTGTPVPPGFDVFPFTDPPITDNRLLHRMPRITLASPAMARGIMELAQAQQVFASHDDLIFDQPKDSTLGPFQNFLNSQRSYEGNYTWMAMLVPKIDRTPLAGATVPYWDPATDVDFDPISSVNLNTTTDVYTLSLIVFARRVVRSDPDKIGVIDQDNPNERVVCIVRAAPIDDFYSGGVGGGDVRLSVRPTALGMSTNVRPKEDLNLREGDWVMMTGEYVIPNPQPPPALNPQFFYIHRWYRVAGLDNEIRNDATLGRWTRRVTLQGPDWDMNNLIKTSVTIVPGVVAVFEKTIRLETSSLWLN